MNTDQIIDDLLEKKREKWLPSDIFKKRYKEIRKSVENIYAEAQISVQLPWFTPHGIEHCKALESNIYDLIPDGDEIKLSESERFFLIIGTWLHDLGMIRNKDEKTENDEIRNSHHRRSEKYIVENFASLCLCESEASILGILAYYHRRRSHINECIEIISVPGHERNIRVQLLAAYLRLADALHIDTTRSPSDKYAILLTYNIPTDSKIHWLRSNFVLATTINSKNKTITIIFKRLTDEVLQICINESTQNEKDQNGNTTFLENNRSQEQKRKFFEQTLESIYENIHQDLEEELNSIKEVLIRGGITCFLNIKKEFCQVEVRNQFLKDIKTILHHYPSINNPSSSALYKIIIDTLLGIIGTSNNEQLEYKKDKIDKFIKDVKNHIIDERKSYYSIINLVNNIEIINNNDKDNFDDVANIIVKKLCKDKKNKIFNYAIINHNNKTAEITTNIIKIISDSHSTNTSSLLEVYLKYKRNKFQNDVKKLRTNAHIYFDECYNTNKYDIPKKIESVINYKNKYLNDNPQNTINILLYGYSELVINTLCGFRDFIITKVIKKLNSEKANTEKSKYLINKIDIEKTASNCFSIFVCEGQPKNKIGWGGKVNYHDGTTYALKLQEYNFNRIFLIPDATTGSLLSINNPLDIHFVVMGCNAYQNGNHVIHSAGHAMISNLTKYLKIEIEKKHPQNKVKPTLIFSLTKDKEEQQSNDNKNKQQSPKDKYKPLKEVIRIKEEWSFYQISNNEEVKNNLFFTHDSKMKNSINSKEHNISIYNPKEDKILFDIIDIIINEDGFINEEENRNCQDKSKIESGMDNKISAK